MHDLLCFSCRQGAEKYLKALLEEQGLTIPRTPRPGRPPQPAAPISLPAPVTAPWVQILDSICRGRALSRLPRHQAAGGCGSGLGRASARGGSSAARTSLRMKQGDLLLLTGRRQPGLVGKMTAGHLALDD